MKLRIAYFCRQCDEEIDLEKILISKMCPFCRYSKKGISAELIYEWKVEDRGDIVQIGINGINGIKWGDSCPIDTLDRINRGLKKLDEHS